MWEAPRGSLGYFSRPHWIKGHSSKEDPWIPKYRPSDWWNMVIYRDEFWQVASSFTDNLDMERMESTRWCGFFILRHASSKRPTGGKDWMGTLIPQILCNQLGFQYPMSKSIFCRVSKMMWYISLDLQWVLMVNCRCLSLFTTESFPETDWVCQDYLNSSLSHVEVAKLY